MPSILEDAELKLLSLSVAGAFAAQARLTGKRGTHAVGAGAIGRFERDASCTLEGVPESSSCRVRFANLRIEDDLGKDVRGMAVSLDDAPLDLLLNSGDVNLFWDGPSLLRFLAAGVRGDAGLRDYADHDVESMTVLQRAMRRAPCSYLQVRYDTAMSVALQTREGPRLARFAAWPLEGEESGVPVGEDHDRPWDSARTSGVEGPEDTLRAQLADEAAAGGAMRLTVQLRPAADVADDGACRTSAAWDPTRWPHRRLGRVQLGGGADADGWSFRPGRLPEGWAIPECAGPEDPRVVGALREAVYSASREARARHDG